LSDSASPESKETRRPDKLAAQEAVAQFLAAVSLFRGLDADALALVVGGLEPIALKAGDILFAEGDPAADLYVVYRGKLAVLTERAGGRPRKIGHVTTRQCVGEMGLVSAGKRSATVVADTDAVVLRLARPVFQSLLARYPQLKSVLGAIITERLPKLRAILTDLFGAMEDDVLRDIESYLSWRRLARDEVLFKQGDPGDALYMVIHGRLQVSVQAEGKDASVIGEVARGEWVGEMALLDGLPRSATVVALRDSELMGLSRDGFDLLVAKHPQILLPMMRMLTRRLRSTNVPDQMTAAPSNSLTVAIVPLNRLPEFFIDTLSDFMAKNGRVLVLTASAFDEVHGPQASQIPHGDPRSGYLSSWLSQLEDEYEYIIFVGENRNSEWTQRCLRHADRIVYSVWHDLDELYETTSVWSNTEKVHAQHDVLLWHDGSVKTLPSRTREILDYLGIENHHHIRTGEVEDVKRIGRFLMNRSVGLVLSGGGARGFAQIGVYRALRDAGVIIDRVGGTSIGGFIGALIACEFEYDDIVRHVRRVLVDKGGFGWTLPLTALLQVRESEQRLKDIFEGRDITDTWLNFFCCTTNLTTAHLAVHHRGPLWRAIRATTAVPGLCPPIFMTGDVHVDGAVLDNLPIDIMAGAHPGPIIACDVTKSLAMTVDPALDAPPSGWSRLFRSSSGSGGQLPSIADILTRSLDCTSRFRFQTNQQIATLYLAPPVGDYRLLDMHRFEELVESGYRYAASVLKDVDVAMLNEYRRDPRRP
jgi:NTE family protein/lysophospholipid hydrolase